jgi:MOSC domain-containing protein YiiM
VDGRLAGAPARHRSREALDAGLDELRASPVGEGILRLIVRRPAEGEREVLSEATLDEHEGIVGDRWEAAGFGEGPERFDMQLTLMNARAAALIAGEPENWPPAGDQLYVELSLAGADLPPGSRLELGSALIEITAEPHTGCGKFVRRYGIDAMKFVNSPVGRELNLRGVNARVVRGGVVAQGDVIRRLDDGR